MRETIILSESLNEREFLKTLAVNGYNSINLHVFNAENLAKEVLLKNGLITNKKQINSLNQYCIVFNILSEIPYFRNNNFEDAKHITESLNYARKLCRGNEEEKINEVFSDGEFKEKNSAIKEVYKKYKQYLKDRELTDSIEIINEAILNGKTLDADFNVLKETPLEPLEEELLKVVSGNHYEIKTIREFADKKDKKLNDVTYANAYGSVNETEYILGYAVKNKIRFDDCLIVLLDNSYSKHFLNYRDVYQVPMTFGIGQDISLSNGFKILTLLDRWNKQFNAINSLNDLIYAPEFNTKKFWNAISDKELDGRTRSEIIATVGNLKLSVYENAKLSRYKDSLSDENEIKRCPYIEKFANELYKGYSYLIKTYTNIDNEVTEGKAISTICTYIDDYFENLSDKNKEIDLPQQLDDIISNLSNKKILREASKPGYLHLCDLKGALSCIRKHLFICGLNANTFPGSPKEDYLLLDSDLNRFKEASVTDSGKKIQMNKQLLCDVVDNAAAFGSCVHLSYSGYNLADLKQENPSSMLFELFKKERGEEATTEDLEKAIGDQRKYFDEPISLLKKIGSEYLKGRLVSVKTIEEDEKVSSSELKYAISPSAADIFFSCPRRFYLTKILHITEPEDDDPFITFPSNDEGTLVHECMEDYGNHPDWSEDDFMENANKKFENYFNKRIPLHDKGRTALKSEYLRMAKEGYENDPKDKKVIASEKYLGPYEDPITGLKFGGIVDRLEKLSDGSYRIVDYKTYKDIRNVEGDIDSCFQVVLYAHILENSEKDAKVDDCEYRYLRNPRTIKVGYQDIKHRLEDKLEQIKSALDTGDFPCASDPDEACKYCKLKDICGIKKEGK